MDDDWRFSTLRRTTCMSSVTTLCGHPQRSKKFHFRSSGFDRMASTYAYGNTQSSRDKRLMMASHLNSLAGSAGLILRKMFDWGKERGVGDYIPQQQSYLSVCPSGRSPCFNSPARFDDAIGSLEMCTPVSKGGLSFLTFVINLDQVRATEIKVQTNIEGK